MGSVSYLYKQIKLVVKKGIAAYSGALCLPIKPNSSDAVVKAVVVNVCINGGVQLNCRNLPPHKVVAIADIINSVAVYVTKSAAQMTYNSILTAVIDNVVSDCVGAYALLTPTNMACHKHRFKLCSVAWLSVITGADIMTC